MIMSEAVKPTVKLPVTFTADITTQEEYDMIQSIISDLKGKAEKDSVQETLANNFVCRPFDTNKQARVLIAGTPVATGNRPDMKKRYDQERAMNPNNRIALQEYVDGRWLTKTGTKRLH